MYTHTHKHRYFAMSTYNNIIDVFYNNFHIMVVCALPFIYKITLSIQIQQVIHNKQKTEATKIQSKTKYNSIIT